MRGILCRIGIHWHKYDNSNLKWGPSKKLVFIYKCRCGHIKKIIKNECGIKQVVLGYSS